LDLEDVTNKWSIVNGQANEWRQILPKISRANCQSLGIWSLSEPVYEEGILKSLDGIQFPHLTELSLAEIRL
jgi:hypothetical protein